MSGGVATPGSVRLRPPLHERDLAAALASEPVQRLLRLTRQLLGTSHALIALGLESGGRCVAHGSPALPEALRGLPLCTLSQWHGGVLWIADGRADPRLALCPLVHGDPALVFGAGAPLHGPDGEPLGALCVLDARARPFVHDEAAQLADLAACVDDALARHAEWHLTDELARERQQLESEQRRFRSVVDSTQGIVWEADADSGTFRYVSQQGERLLGYRIVQWQTPGFWVSLLHPQDRERMVALRRQEATAGRDHTADYRVQARDGRTVWLRDVVSVGADRDGTPTLRGIMIDISADHAAAATQREASATLPMALRAAGIGTWQVDLGSGVQSWDAQMWRLLGIGDDASPEARDLAMESLDLPGLAAAAHGDAERAQQLTRTIRRCDSGETRQLAVSAMRVDTPGGAAQLVGTAWDCSTYSRREFALRERQEALQQLVEAQTLTAVQARHRAERAAALQGEFLANVSHELRTPLHAILGFLALAADELAEAGEPDRPRLQQRISKAHAAASRLLGLVDDLLDLAKLESGRTTLLLAPISLTGILDTVVDELQPLHAARGVRVQRHGLAEPLPLVLADGQRVGQVFRNVLANASRYSPEGGLIEICIQVDGAGWVDVLVLDQGPGIPEGEEESIFDKFVQSSRSLQGRSGGTGLGLPIAREIMRAHGGDIDAANRADGGAQFRIRFPGADERDIEALR